MNLSTKPPLELFSSRVSHRVHYQSGKILKMTQTFRLQRIYLKPLRLQQPL